MEEVKEKTEEEKVLSFGERFLSREEKQIQELRKAGFSPEEVHPLKHFDIVRRYKSPWRAIRKNLASVDGTIYPKRPFNNRKPTRGREMNENKKKFNEFIKAINKHVPETQPV